MPTNSRPRRNRPVGATATRSRRTRRNPKPRSHRLGGVTRFLGSVLAVLVVLAVVVLERSEAGIGLLGALVGLLAALAGLQLGMLTGAVVFGARVHRIVVGFGRLVREWRSPRTSIVLRGVPVLLSLSVGPGRAPARLRLWLCGLCSALLGVATVVGLWFVATGPFGRGAVLAATATVLHALIPRRSAASTSTGWQLLGLPRLPPDQVAELDAAGLADEVLSAVNAGDLPTAEAVADRLAREYPDLRSTTTARVTVLEARGHYAEALALVLELVTDRRQTDRDMAFTCAGLASVAALAVEAGEAPAELIVPIARDAVADAERLGFPPYKLHGTKAVLALVDGDASRAVSLARSAVAVTDHAISRADNLATLARALMATGDNAAAREVLTQAEAIAPWWPRVASTRTRLEVS